MLAVEFDKHQDLNSSAFYMYAFVSFIALLYISVFVALQILYFLCSFS
jgi:hypothetical protein